jgi:ATP-dependent Clp protease protease subunit
MVDKPTLEKLERLLQDRRVPLLTVIDDWTAKTVLEFLERVLRADRHAPLQLVVNSPGGEIRASLAIYEALAKLPVPLETLCINHAGGTAALLVAAGTRGRRYALPQATFSLAPIESTSRDPGIQDTVEIYHDRVAEQFALRMGRPADVVRAELMMGATLTAKQAVAGGLIDAVDELALGRRLS